jgi:capsular exopolysaccharide synthesis family protein
MSRVDEALKRALELPVPVGPRRPRPADFTSPLDQFAGEVVSPPPPPTGELQAVRPVVPAPSFVSARRRIVRTDDERRGKLVTDVARTGVSTEQYRLLAATLHEAQAERGLKTVMVTSAVPQEGKTLTVVNLALTLSEAYGRRVLLIDADLRWPSVHELLDVACESGLSQSLASTRRALPIVEVTPRLCVLPAGRPETNPLAGLSSERMPAILDEVSAAFDWVLLDSPPVGILPDAQLVARLVQGVVFVIGANSTPFPLVERAIADLGRECIIGTVLNGVEERAIPATSPYGHYYTGKSRP